VSALRKIVGSDAIITVSGRGYQFTLPVTMGDGEANRASRSKHNLPYQLTNFIGREQIAQLEELVTAHRLVTLTGAGGAAMSFGRAAVEVWSPVNRRNAFMLNVKSCGVRSVQSCATSGFGIA